MSQPFHKLFNAGTSAGAVKGWDSRRGAHQYASDTNTHNNNAINEKNRPGGKWQKVYDHAMAASDSARKSDLSYIQSGDHSDKTAAIQAHLTAASAHRNSAAGGSPMGSFHMDLARAHDNRARAMENQGHLKY